MENNPLKTPDLGAIATIQDVAYSLFDMSSPKNIGYKKIPIGHHRKTIFSRLNNRSVYTPHNGQQEMDRRVKQREDQKIHRGARRLMRRMQFKALPLNTFAQSESLAAAIADGFMEEVGLHKYALTNKGRAFVGMPPCS